MASKRHTLVGQILSTDSRFANYLCQEEVPVSKLVPTFPDNRKRVDWYIPELKVVIEVHGEQHYRGIRFGGEKTKSQNWTSQVHRDIQKQAALENAGFIFVEVPYWTKLNADSLWDLIYGVYDSNEGGPTPLHSTGNVSGSRSLSGTAKIPSRQFNRAGSNSQPNPWKELFPLTPTIPKSEETSSD